jgi:phage-related protein
VLFTTAGPRMILLHGFIKKSQKTPKDDLELANKRLKMLE